MSVIAPKFKLSEFIKSLLDNIFWILIIMVSVGVPAVFVVLLTIELPVIDGELLTPFLALTMLSDPSRLLPLVHAFMATDIFRVAVFPGFGFAALLAAGTIFVERKMLAKTSAKSRPILLWEI